MNDLMRFAGALVRFDFSGKNVSSLVQPFLLIENTIVW